jgi:hypothetical protein
MKDDQKKIRQLLFDLLMPFELSMHTKVSFNKMQINNPYILVSKVNETIGATFFLIDVFISVEHIKKVLCCCKEREEIREEAR